MAESLVRAAAAALGELSCSICADAFAAPEVGSWSITKDSQCSKTGGRSGSRSQPPPPPPKQQQQQLAHTRAAAARAPQSSSKPGMVAGGVTEGNSGQHHSSIVPTSLVVADQQNSANKHQRVAAQPSTGGPATADSRCSKHR